MAFKFQNYKTTHAAKEALNKILPPGSSREAIIQQMQNAGATLYELQGNVLPARFVESSLTMVHVVWGLAFCLNKDMKLDRSAREVGLGASCCAVTTRQPRSEMLGYVLANPTYLAIDIFPQ